MQIRPVPGTFAPPLRHTAAPAPGAADTVELGRPRSAVEAARLLMRKGLDKKDTPYQVRDGLAGPDGSLYLLYSTRDRGYLARVSPEGRIAWELPLEEEGLRQLGALPGGVRVGTSHGAVAVGEDGRVLRREGSPQEVESQWTDAAGVRYELLKDRSLRAVDARGSEVPLPPLPRLDSGGPLPDGGLLLRAEGQAFALAPGGTLQHAWKLPDWPREGRTSHAVPEVWPLSDGGLMVQKLSITVIPAQFDDLPPGGHMGGALWDPAPTSMSDMRLVRLDRDGHVVWQSDTLGSSARVAVFPDGTALADGYGGSIRRIDAGKVEKAFDLSGSVHEFRTEPGGTLLVGHGGIWTRVAPDGSVLAETSSHPDHSGAALVGLLPDGRLLFRDAEGRNALRCRLETGEWEALTDPTGDHSAILAAREQVREGPAPQVVDGDGWVLIGDVELRRNG